MSACESAFYRWQDFTGIHANVTKESEIKTESLFWEILERCKSSVQVVCVYISVCRKLKFLGAPFSPISGQRKLKELLPPHALVKLKNFFAFGRMHEMAALFASWPLILDRRKLVRFLAQRYRSKIP